MNYSIPIELVYIIYKYSDIQTRIKLNKIFKISFYTLNPLQGNINKDYPLLQEKPKLKDSSFNFFNFTGRGY